MDDRTAIASCLDDALHVQRVWRTFATAFHLAENVSKTRFVDIKQDTLTDVKPFAEVLGCSLDGLPSRM